MPSSLLDKAGGKTTHPSLRHRIRQWFSALSRMLRFYNSFRVIENGLCSLVFVGFPILFLSMGRCQGFGLHGENRPVRWALTTPTVLSCPATSSSLSLANIIFHSSSSGKRGCQLLIFRRWLRHTLDFFWSLYDSLYSSVCLKRRLLRRRDRQSRRYETGICRRMKWPLPHYGVDVSC